MQHIKNIIFDFGGVIIDIHHDRVEKAFRKLGIENFEALFNQATQSKLFIRFETGGIAPATFRNEIRSMCDLPIDDVTLDHAWNCIIGDYPSHRIELLKSLTANYRLFLLSNTNIIHFDHYIPKFENEFGYEFFSLFEKTYWSFEIGKRKPNLDAWKHVIMDSNLRVEETLFIDDSIQNIAPAKELGITTLLLINGVDISSHFNNGILL
jgi:putative hydrolase of the HAD superfamily